jgi:hypothetical protein
MRHCAPVRTIQRRPLNTARRSWAPDRNVNSGMSNYGSEMYSLVQTLQSAGLQPYTYYPGGHMGIYYFTTLDDGASVWLSMV